ncbi:signal peptidase I [bacterium]|nr:signal peptidase I [bacterium]
MNKKISIIWEVLKIIMIASIIVVPVRYFLFQPFVVRGQSMEPNFHNGDYLIVDELSYRLRDPQRGEIVVFRSPIDPAAYYIKRIIGLPAETVIIKGGKITIYTSQGKEIDLNELDYLPSSSKTSGNLEVSLGKDQYFVLGDNRSASYDSRRFGPISREDIIGRVYLRAWPLELSARIEVPSY